MTCDWHARAWSPSGVPLPVAAPVVLVRTRKFACLERRALGAAVTWDEIAPGLRLCQLRDGHRFSNDDRLTAFFATEAAPDATRLLDLGAGVGSVGLAALARASEKATLTCVEAQRVSHELCRRTVAANGLSSRVALVHADLRDFAPERPTYDLVTASPPYVAPPPLSQRDALSLEVLRPAGRRPERARSEGALPARVPRRPRRVPLPEFRL